MKYWFVICLLLISTISWAAIGSVVDTKGTSCSIERGKQKLPGDKGVGIESMDTYITGSCVANITFKDDTKVKVTENSRLLIDDFIFDPKQSDAGKLALKVGMGTVRYASGQIAKNNPQKVDIKTPTATIAVRGTDFNMTVDETGQSLIILVPSCKEGEKIKQYELEENQCKVGKIDVITVGGTVSLDKAFEATYVTSANLPPTPPVIINTVEGNISNSLIIAKPQEVMRASRDNNKAKRDLEFEEEQAESNRQIVQRMKQMEEPPPAKVMPYTFDNGSKGCNPSINVCVVFEKQDVPEVQLRGRGVAFRSNPDHYDEVKTQGYDSNTTVNITHDDAPATALIGSGDPGGNIVNIRQNTGVIKTQ
jgi:hypothetical protein